MLPLQNILQQYAPISLAEMDNVRLMDRTDTKYVFARKNLEQVLMNMLPHYRILEVNGLRISRYESLYYDTNNFLLYHQHHCGKANRYKVRSRRYVESALSFFEVKFKNNKGRTIKNRVKQKQIDGSINDKAQSLLLQTPLSPQLLEAQLWVNYSRITLVGVHHPERVTIDTQLHFKNSIAEKQYSDLVIAEVKQDKASGSPFIELMKQMRIREGSISKYCFAVASLNQHIRQNNFKQIIRQLNRIDNDNARCA